MGVLLKEDHPYSSANNGEYDDVPIGWRFMPTDQELIVSYLSRKVAFTSLPAKIIKEIDAAEFYKYHPNNLVDNVVFNRDNRCCNLEMEWYLFINHDEYFHGRINKMKRVGEDNNIGFWRSDGKEEAIYDIDGNIFAYKIQSTFFSSKSKKTNWKMEVYRLVHRLHDDENSSRDEWVVARIRGAQNYFDL